MLNKERLVSNTLLVKSGWNPLKKTDIRKIYDDIEKGVCENKYGYFLPQVSIDEIFPKAWEVIESLNGVRIQNMHSELGFGKDSYVIAFDFFEYDMSNAQKLQELYQQYKKRFLYIGIGYDIIGNWLIDEDGMIYFYDEIRNRMHPVSLDIYEFLERDIYQLVDMNGESIFSD